MVPTPFASHAFHPLDGFAQSVPYHVYPYLFPLQKFAYLGLFVFINMWTISIRESSISVTLFSPRSRVCLPLQVLRDVTDTFPRSIHLPEYAKQSQAQFSLVRVYGKKES